MPTIAYRISTIPQTVYGSVITVIAFNNCMRSTANLNVVPKHIVTSPLESPFLIIQHLSVLSRTNPIFQYFSFSEQAKCPAQLRCT